MTAFSYIKSVLPRAVYIRVQPQPLNLHETRTILKILKDYGEVDLFRSLRNDPVAPAPNTILAVFRHKESASKLIEEAPLQFQVPPRNDQPSGIMGMLYDESVRSQLEDRPRLTAKEGSHETKPRELYITAESSNFDHQGYIRRQEYYWGFRSADSFANRELSKSVPTEGLGYISSRQAQVPTRVVNKMMEKVASGKPVKQLLAGKRANPTSP